MARSGVSYVTGREGRGKYNESLAGIQWQNIRKTIPHEDGVMDSNGNLLFPLQGYESDFETGEADFRSNNINFQAIITPTDGNKVPIVKPDNYDPERYEIWRRWLNKLGEDFELSDFVWAGNRGDAKFPFNDLQSMRQSKLGFSTSSRKLYWDYPDAGYVQQERIVKAEKKFFLGLIYFLGHDPNVDLHPHVRGIFDDFGLPLDEYVDNDHVPYWLYVRTGRRLVGQYVLTQHDAVTDLTKEDSVATGEHRWDVHINHTVAVADEDGDARAHRNEPFCLIVAFKAPHGPYKPAKRYRNKYDNVEMPKGL